MTYDNILKALSTPKQGQTKILSLEEKNRNYQLFDELMRKGVSLDELLRVAEGKRTPDAITTEVFSVMEDAVKEDEKVKVAREKATRLKAEVLSEICMKDERYRTALEEYRKVVSEVYVHNKEDKGGEE